MTRLTYKKSGVDIEKGDLISKAAFNQLKKTLSPDAFSFQNLIGIKARFPNLKDPYLAFASDGVGTKLIYTFKLNQVQNVGIDVVAMCVNDLVRNNIKPLSFALYRATGKISEKTMFEVAEGVTNACLESDCVYATGESAEMAGFYKKGEFDLAGFATGVFDKDKLISGKGIKEGDTVIGLTSSGLHSNGFSLVRQVFPPEKIRKNSKLHQEIIAPTRIYVKAVLETNKKFEIKAWAHITGSGLFGKLGKILPDNLVVELKQGSWPVQDIFTQIATIGKIPEREMFRTFNMGIGFVGIVPTEKSSQLIAFLKTKGEEPYVIGEVVRKNFGQKVFLNK